MRRVSKRNPCPFAIGTGFLLREHPDIFGRPLQPDDTWQERYIVGKDVKSPELRFWLSAATGGVAPRGSGGAPKPAAKKAAVGRKKPTAKSSATTAKKPAKKATKKKAAKKAKAP